MGNLSDFEKQLVTAAIPELKKNIQKGEDFVKKNQTVQLGCAEEQEDEETKLHDYNNIII